MLDTKKKLSKPKISWLSHTKYPANRKKMLFMKGGETMKIAELKEKISEALEIEDPEELKEAVGDIMEELDELEENPAADLVKAIQDALEGEDVDEAKKILAKLASLLKEGYGKPAEGNEVKDLLAGLKETIEMAEKKGNYGAYPGTLTRALKKVMSMKSVSQMREAIEDLIAKRKKYAYPTAYKKSETVEFRDEDLMTAGQYFGKEWGQTDFQKIVDNFTALKDEVKVPLKLGHDEGQDLLKKSGLVGEDGQPAAGWVENIRIKNGNLVGDFVQVPVLLAELITNGAYKRKSVEVYKDYVDSDGKSWGPVLRAVAMLGADIPKIKDLNDITNLYGATFIKSYDVFVVESESKATEWTDCIKKHIKDGKDMKEAAEACKKELKMEGGGEMSESTEERLAQLEKKEKDSERSEFVDSVIESGRVLPKDKEKVLQMMEALSENKVLKFTDKDGKELLKSQLDLYKEQLSSGPVVVNFEELAHGGVGGEETEEEKAAKLAETKIEDARKKGQVLQYSEALIEAHKELKIK